MHLSGFFNDIDICNKCYDEQEFFNCLPFLSGYMSVFSIPQRQKWIKAKKNKKASLNDLIHLHSDLIFDHFDVNA